jgi:drug/metabolite transporter (DMT)-like permease
MQSKNMTMFYLSAIIAIVGAVGYQYFVKRVPQSLNPIVSVMAMYVAVLVLSLFLIPLFPAEGGLLNQARKISWIQLALAISVLMIELGFLMMYRYGWTLSTGNIITGVVINLILVGLGVTLFGEKISLINASGIMLCILGVALVSYHP